jgi:DNA invertase Pin-like site-specific DNA recombinase
VLSVAAQEDLAQVFITQRGWAVGPTFTDTMTGAVFTQRPGLQSLLAALTVRPAPFQHLIVETQDRIGRETIDLLPLVRQIERAGVTIWEATTGEKISMLDDKRIVRVIQAEIDTMERKKVAPKVRNRAHQRHAQGFVVGGKVFGYLNRRTCAGCTKDGIGVCKHPSVRVVNEAEAAVVRRIFKLTAEGLGLAKVRNVLNAERVPGPRGAWGTSGVREILHRRDYKGDIITNRQQRSRDDDGNPIRITQPESEWKVRVDESLRIVTDAEWDAAHARVQQTVKSYLRRGHQLVGQVEATKGQYLLSGFCVCGQCGKPLIATKRGRDLNLVYTCREHRERGNLACTNAAGAPAVELHASVITSLRETFTEQTFTAHLEKQAANIEAKEQRAAERQGILVDLPKLAAAEQGLVRRIGTVEDDALVAALKAEWSEVKGQRERAERRLAELEGLERDLQADRAEVEQLRATWATWSSILGAAIDAPAGSIPAEAQQQARQILKKVLTGPVKVTPVMIDPSSAEVAAAVGPRKTVFLYEGHSRFDGVLLGGAVRGLPISVSTPTRLEPGEGVKLPSGLVYIPEISGGSDGSPASRDTDMAPKPPVARATPAEPWRPSISPTGLLAHGRGAGVVTGLGPRSARASGARKRWGVTRRSRRSSPPTNVASDVNASAMPARASSRSMRSPPVGGVPPPASHGSRCTCRTSSRRSRRWALASTRPTRWPRCRMGSV